MGNKDSVNLVIRNTQFFNFVEYHAACAGACVNKVSLPRGLDEESVGRMFKTAFRYIAF